VFKRGLDAIFTALVLIFAIPTTLILVSWNAIPGDRLYQLKSGLENSVLLVFSGTPLVPEVSMKFTDRRIGEATKLLDQKGSTVGYDLLIANARQTQNYIVQKSDIQAATKFDENIDNYQKEIEKKKVEVKAEIQTDAQSQVSAPATQVPVTLPQTVIPTSGTTTVSDNSNTPTPQTVVLNVPQTVTITDEKPVEVLQKLEETQEELEKIREEVKNDAEKDRSEKERNANDSSEDKDHKKRGE
jgi:vacuolar-type H+-ATPase subunit H